MQAFGALKSALKTALKVTLKVHNWLGSHINHYPDNHLQHFMSIFSGVYNMWTISGLPCVIVCSILKAFGVN